MQINTKTMKKYFFVQRPPFIRFCVTSFSGLGHMESCLLKILRLYNDFCSYDVESVEKPKVI